MKKLLATLPFIALTVLIVGCTSFVNQSKKNLYSAAILADGAMKTYAVYWKDQTRDGVTPALDLQRSNAMQLSYEVGAGIAVAERALTAYQNNVGTNTTTKDVVSALIQTAIQRSGSFAGYVALLTGNTNLLSIAK